MRWSWRVARVSGIDLRIHVSFALIVLLGAMQWGTYGPAGMAFGAVLILLLFACVTLHEFGHALVAQRFNIDVREIVLLPIGGVALLSKNPTRASHELLIAAAGPAVNVVIATVLSMVVGLQAAAKGISPLALLSTDNGPSVMTALAWILQANILLVAFNMIPAFPLDGGRILRGLLGLFMDMSRATRIASSVGQVLAVLLGVVGLLSGNFILAIIAMFIFFAAGSTYAEERARTVLATLRVGDAYNKHALSLYPSDPISRVTDYLLTSYQPDFAVLQGRELLGVVSREQVLKALSSADGDVPVTAVMVRDVPRVMVHESLEAVQARMQESQSRLAAVHDARGFLGLVSAEDIAEASLILAFMQRGPLSPAGLQEPSPLDPRPEPSWPSRWAGAKG